MALEFTATTTGGLRIADNASMDISTANCSWAWWIHLNVLAATTIHKNLWNKDSDGTQIFNSISSLGILTVGNAINTNEAFNTAVSSGVWTHMAWTRNNGTLVMYLNGVVDKTVVGASNDTINNAVDLTCGQADNKPVAAYFEDFRWVDRAVSANEIAALNAGYRGPLGGEIVWLPLDSAQGATIWDGVTLSSNTHVLYDLSVNSNVGIPSSLIGRASNAPRMGGYIHE